MELPTTHSQPLTPGPSPMELPTTHCFCVDSRFRGNDGNHFSSFPRKRESILEVPCATAGADPLTMGTPKGRGEKEESLSHRARGERRAPLSEGDRGEGQSPPTREQREAALGAGHRRRVYRSAPDGSSRCRDRGRRVAVPAGGRPVRPPAALVFPGPRRRSRETEARPGPKPGRGQSRAGVEAAPEH